MESIVDSINSGSLATFAGNMFAETNFEECTCGFEARKGRKRGRRAYRRR